MNTMTSGVFTALSGEALEKYRRVKLAGDTVGSREVKYADAGEDAIGITLDKVGDAENVSVLPIGSGTFLCEAAGAITAEAAVYGAADGKIDDTVSGNKFGIALEAASAAGDIIECLPARVADVLALQALISDPAAAAAMTQNTLTDNGAGTADQTVEDVADIALSTTDTYTDAAVNGAVNTAIASISNNFKEMTTELALIKTDTAALKTAIDANNAAIDSIIDALQANGIVATA